MAETSRLEKRTRVLADAYMAVHPGVPRQEAKRRVRHRARSQLAAQGVREMREVALSFVRAFGAPLSLHQD